MLCLILELFQYLHYTHYDSLLPLFVLFQVNKSTHIMDE